MIGNMVEQAFLQARQRQPETAKRWRDLSWRWGPALPDSALTGTIQSHGKLDLLVRAPEDEVAERIRAGHTDEGSRDDDVILLSHLWVSGAYETVRLVYQRKIEKDNGPFRRLRHELALVRMPIDKHVVAYTDSKRFKAPIPMMRSPNHGDAPAQYVFDPNSLARSHIMPGRPSERGSLTWLATDVVSCTTTWIERRDLSDRILAFAEALPIQPSRR
ncbi:hypothetical protein [Methylobacterium oxalidis]|uniref:Uncharacterized protein n=1 Tax=Methylobacterium oxalidis TaxID=944322 RepID=A0A512J157_9HYPH|nr:hypothetical protein [Methylobacterium oxalidis]GEP03701.1 hypothetical protein MOX02_17390 [Methylobacterium oxalidis]GJE33693.1 hypothetical protein LDDCCGHA_3896 [Methylobacterium oxalidis]GLS62285.1 hypothetical protein GCM10007888_06660 [Methylobacterium oxalidis]